MRSMTAYAHVVKEIPGGRWVLELHSVNRKLLDMNLYVPREYLRFDIDMRKWIAEELARGQITLRLTKVVDPRSAQARTEKAALFQALKAEWEHVALALGYEVEKSVTLSFLANQSLSGDSVITKEEEEQLRTQLQEACAEALEQLVAMKEREGSVLQSDMEERLSAIRAWAEAIKERAPAVLAAYQKKLEERVQAAVGTTDERLLKEVVLYAEKVDITEETVRLASHLKQFGELVRSGEKSVGRTLDFLTQEMNREMNTMAAKSVDAEASLLVVKMKAELEKIKEQVQNIE